MKTIQKTYLLLAIPALLLSATGCMVIRPVPVHIEHRHRTLPPGQHKKIHGHQSAKYFAPGQQKKHR